MLGRQDWLPFAPLLSSLSPRVNLHELPPQSSAPAPSLQREGGKSSLCQGRCYTLKALQIWAGVRREVRRFISLGLDPGEKALSSLLCPCTRAGLGFPQRGTAEEMSLGPVGRPLNFPQSKTHSSFSGAFFHSSSLCS